MAFTSDDLTAVERAIATGTMKVQYADRAVTYASQQELLALRQLIKAELAGTSATARTARASFSRE